MRHVENIPSFLSKTSSPLCLIVCAVAALCFSQLALAQSGRRQSKPASPSSPSAPNEAKAESPATPPTAKPAPVSVIVGGDRAGSSIVYLPSAYVDVAIIACVDRLRERPGLAIIESGHMTRKMALERAKKETGAYVLFIEIRAEAGGTNNLAIGYSVFAPQTGKVLTSGLVYPGNKGVGNGRVVVGVPSVTKHLPIEFQLKEGGEEIADRVRGKF